MKTQKIFDFLYGLFYKNYYKSNVKKVFTFVMPYGIMYLVAKSLDNGLTIYTS